MACPVVYYKGYSSRDVQMIPSWMYVEMALGELGAN